MKILIACEFSGIVRDAFKKQDQDYDVWSCDLLNTEIPGQHIRDDVLGILNDGWDWDMVIAFPPCTHLAVSGARWFEEKRGDGSQQSAIDFFMEFVNCGVPKIAVENPIGIMSTVYRKPDQIIQPWQFGHGETKATCLWLKGGLPKLSPSHIVKGRVQKVHNEPPSVNRWKNRSRTYRGIAEAMATTWGFGGDTI